MSVQLVHRAFRATKAFKVLLALLVLKVFKGILDQLALQVFKANKAL
jgi:hypothetical protein